MDAGGADFAGAPGGRLDAFWQDAPAGSVGPAVGFDPGLSAYAEEPSRRSRTKDPRKASYYRSMRALVLGVVTLAVAVIAYLVVVYSPLFEIKAVSANPTAHVTTDTIMELAPIPEGTTLFNVDRAAIEAQLSASPWVASVTLTRQLPDTLSIEVEERTAVAVVMLTNGAEAWSVASDGHWLESVPLDATPAADGTVASPAQQARTWADRKGLVFIEDVSALVKPVAGEACTDPAILAVLTYLKEFGGALRGMVDAAKAPSEESVSVVLSNGIEVSLGEPGDVALKEQVVLELLELYLGQMTYINVREPLYPTWRGLDADAVGAIPEDGGGAVFDSVTYGTPEMYAQIEDPSVVVGTESGEFDPYAGMLVGREEGGPGGSLDMGGYYSDAGPWVYAYYDAEGNWINGYYEDDGTWVQIS